MKIIGKKSWSLVMRVLLDAVMILGIILFTWISIDTLRTADLADRTGLKVFLMCVFGLGTAGLLLVIYSLRGILDSLVKGDPFQKKNVFRLRRIAGGCFIAALCYFLNIVVNPGYGPLKLLYMDAKGIHTDLEMFIFIFAGVIVLILSYVFDQAVIYKQENDLTI